MDDADTTQRNEEFLMEARLRALRAAAQAPSPPACGRCYYCSEVVRPGLRYCDAGCRDDHADQLAHERRNGTAMERSDNEGT